MPTFPHRACSAAVVAAGLAGMVLLGACQAPLGRRAPTALDANGRPGVATQTVVVPVADEAPQAPGGEEPQPTAPLPPPGVQDLPEAVVRAPPMTQRVYRQRTSLRTARSESARVGPYNQPEWTTQRRFATTRAYVLSQGQVELETWWKGKFDEDSEPDHLFQQEIGIGLPHRFQLDFYVNVTHEPDADALYQGTQVELRYALADWGCLPLNPTLYAEYKFNVHDAPDAWEAKLLLSEDIGCRWHAAANLFYEREVSGSLAEEMGVSAALGYALIDQHLGVGAEVQVERATEKGSRGDPEQEVLLGPSIQWRPWRNAHLDIVPLSRADRRRPDRGGHHRLRHRPRRGRLGRLLADIGPQSLTPRDHGAGMGGREGPGTRLLAGRRRRLG